MLQLPEVRALPGGLPQRGGSDGGGLRPRAAPVSAQWRDDTARMAAAALGLAVGDETATSGDDAGEVGDDQSMRSAALGVATVAAAPSCVTRADAAGAPAVTGSVVGRTGREAQQEDTGTQRGVARGAGTGAAHKGAGGAEGEVNDGQSEDIDGAVAAAGATSQSKDRGARRRVPRVAGGSATGSRDDNKHAQSKDRGAQATQGAAQPVGARRQGSRAGATDGRGVAQSEDRGARRSEARATSEAGTAAAASTVGAGRQGSRAGATDGRGAAQSEERGARRGTAGADPGRGATHCGRAGARGAEAGTGRHRGSQRGRLLCRRGHGRSKDGGARGHEACANAERFGSRTIKGASNQGGTRSHVPMPLPPTGGSNEYTVHVDNEEYNLKCADIVKAHLQLAHDMSESARSGSCTCSADRLTGSSKPGYGVGMIPALRAWDPLLNDISDQLVPLTRPPEVLSGFRSGRPGVPDVGRTVPANADCSTAPEMGAARAAAGGRHLRRATQEPGAAEAPPLASSKAGPLGPVAAGGPNVVREIPVTADCSAAPAMGAARAAAGGCQLLRAAQENGADEAPPLASSKAGPLGSVAAGVLQDGLEAAPEQIAASDDEADVDGSQAERGAEQWRRDEAEAAGMQAAIRGAQAVKQPMGYVGADAAPAARARSAALAAARAAARTAARKVGAMERVYPDWFDAGVAWRRLRECDDALERASREGVASAMPGGALDAPGVGKDPFHPRHFECEFTTHEAKVRRDIRREQYHEFACTDVRQDHTLHDPRQSGWRASREQRPRAGDPRAMIDEYKRHAPCPVDHSLPTCDCSTSKQYKVWQQLHNATCVECRLHSAAQLVTATSVAAVRAWAPSCSPHCYGEYLIHSVRTGFEPHFNDEVRPTNLNNHRPTYEDYKSTVQHLQQVEAMPHPVFSDGTFSKPKVSNALLTVVREKHRDKAAKDGSVPKGRVALDTKSSSVNESAADWPFVYDDEAAAARVIVPGGWSASLDLEKCFNYYAAGAAFQEKLYFSDPRRETKWPGPGAAPPEWRQRKQKRRGRWRKYLTCPFGFKCLPAWSSALAGEMCKYARMLGVSRVVMYIDDMFVSAVTAATCGRHLQVAKSLMVALGMKPSESKEVRPTQSIEYLGYTFVDGKITVSGKRQRQAAERMTAILQRGSTSFDEIQRLAGLLSWYCLVLVGTRTWIRGMWDFMKEQGEGDEQVELSPALRRDMEWWVRRVNAGELRGSRIIDGGAVTAEAVLQDWFAAIDAEAAYEAAEAEGVRQARANGDWREEAKEQPISAEVYAVDLACGAGGFRQGMDGLDGVTTVLAMDGCPEAVSTYKRNFGGDVRVQDITDVSAVVAAIRGTGKPVGLITAGCPCQPFSPSGLGDPDDERLDVMGCVITIALGVGAQRLVLENVPRALWHPVGMRACARLTAAGYTVETAVVDAAKLPGGAPQARVRGIVIATRLQDGCGLQQAASAVSRRPRITVEQAFGWRGTFYHRHRRNGGKCVYGTWHASPTLRTNCASRPRRAGYVRRAQDDGGMHDCTIWTVQQLGLVQGFPAEFDWPADDLRCKCNFCRRGGVTSAGRQIGNAIVPRMANWAVRLALAAPSPSFPPGSGRDVDVKPVRVRTRHLDGMGPMLTVKSDASGSQRWGYLYVDAADHGQLVWGQLGGADAEASALVAFFEMCAVHQAVVAHCSEWRGYTIRLGVDSAPVSGSINSGTSHDDGIMELLRDMSNAMVEGGFTLLSVHVTREHNSLTDQLTRHRCVQDVVPFLASEGFNARALEGSADSFQVSSRVQNSGIWRQQLGRRQRCDASPQRSELGPR